MISELFHIGSFAVSPFGAMLMVAFIAAYLQLKRGMIKIGIGDEEDASSILFAGGVGGILGGKIYYAALYRDPGLLLERFGIVWYGSFLLGLLAILWTVRRRGLPLSATMDCAAPALALGYGLGRVGCFLVGDDYGVPTDLPWGTVFKVGLPPTTAGDLRYHFDLDIPAAVADGEWVAVHPTQLYETLIAFGIWGFALWLFAQRKRSGTVILATLALLACERFSVELLRAKDDRFFGSLTLAQVISLIILLSAVAIWRLRSLTSDEGPAGESPA